MLVSTAWRAEALVARPTRRPPVEEDFATDAVPRALEPHQTELSYGVLSLVIGDGTSHPTHGTA